MTYVEIADKTTAANSPQGEDVMPSSLTELQPIVEEFITRLKAIKHEQELLKEDEKNLVEEFGEKLDMKTLKAAMRVVSVKEKVQHKDSFDTMLEILERL